MRILAKVTSTAINWGLKCRGKNPLYNLSFHEMVPPKLPNVIASFGDIFINCGNGEIIPPDREILKETTKPKRKEAISPPSGGDN